MSPPERRPPGEPRSPGAGCWIIGCALLLLGFSCVVAGTIILWLALRPGGHSPAFQAPPEAEAEAEAETIIDGIPVHCRNNPQMFPESWRVAPYNAAAGELGPGEYRRGQSAIRTAAKAYPHALLRRYLTGIYLVDSLNFRGVVYGGTNSTSVLYLADGGEARGFTVHYLIGEFHHELAHILRRQNLALLDSQAWEAANPPDFHYRGDAVESLRAGHNSLQLDEASLSRGFLGDYAMSNEEEDFTVTAVDLFQADDAFWRSVDSHPAVAKKVHLAIEFYRKLDPSFTEEQFRHPLQAE